MNPRRMMLGCLGWCPGVSAAARFLPDREMGERTMAVSVTFTALALVLVAAYSGYAAISEDRAREDYAKSLFTGFEIVDVGEKQMSAYYRDGEFLYSLQLRDADEFMEVARRQGVHVLYRVADYGRCVYYYFESPVYRENYMVFEREIAPISMSASRFLTAAWKNVSFFGLHLVKSRS